MYSYEVPLESRTKKAQSNMQAIIDLGVDAWLAQQAH